MRSHPFDAVSAALGLVAGAIGTLVALGGTDSIDTGWWLALGALVLGLGLLPWARVRHPVADVDADSIDAGEATDPPRLRL